MEEIGITTTVPVEVVLAAGMSPVDLNNWFVSSPEREAMLARAEASGFPVNLCAWIKGIWAAAGDRSIKTVVGVTRGDCSSAEKLIEVWEHQGIRTIPFAYPPRPDPERMAEVIAAMAQALGTSPAEAERVREKLLSVRQLLKKLDEITWEGGKVTGAENHLWLCSASDFKGDPGKFSSELEGFLEEAGRRTPEKDFLRLGYAGVPPIIDDLHQFLESRGARVVYNEVQRQFAMLGDFPDLAAQYAAYTYPYSTGGRIADIKEQIKLRGIRGMIHYAQTFCHRQIESILLRAELPVPVLVIEADRPGPLDARTRTRIEAFLEQVS